MNAKSLLLKAGLLGAVGGYVWASVPPAMTMTAEQRATAEASVFYAGCNDARAQGKAPILAGQPGYRGEMDGDGDGVACEPYRY
jgi:hypothetical protein